ncbi:MAG: FAD-binding protein [Paracoccaceae bacterium]
MWASMAAIHLTLAHLPAEALAERLQAHSQDRRDFRRRRCHQRADPVLPTVHYNMGGIPTNYWGEVLNPTAKEPNRVVPGLMAVGGPGCASVHGANRLGSGFVLTSWCSAAPPRSAPVRSLTPRPATAR